VRFDKAIALSVFFLETLHIESTICSISSRFSTRKNQNQAMRGVPSGGGFCCRNNGCR